MTQSVYTILLTFNGWENTFECLESISKNDYTNNKVIILYFTLQDETKVKLISRYPWAELIQLSENNGYAGNNNFGINYAIEKGADWILILNDDTILAPDFYRRLMQAAEEDPMVGILGPMVYHADEPEIIQSAGGYFDKNWHALHIGMNQKDNGQFKSVREVDWVNGCSILCRADLLRKSGGLDQRFFLYNEEVDLCYRAKQYGWKIKFVPDAKIWHKGVNRNYQPSPDVTYYMVRNHFFFLYKHHAAFDVKIRSWFEQIRTIVSYSIRPKWKNKRIHRNAALQGMKDFLLNRWGKRAS